MKIIKAEMQHEKSKNVNDIWIVINSSITLGLKCQSTYAALDIPLGFSDL
jgi:hypothetical protein